MPRRFFVSTTISKGITPLKFCSKNLRSVYTLSVFGRSSTINATVFNLKIPAIANATTAKVTPTIAFLLFKANRSACNNKFVIQVLFKYFTCAGFGAGK